MLLRTAKSRGPDAPTLASSLRSRVGPTGLRQNISVDDGGKTARSPGRARHKPLKPLRAGMPGDSGVLVYSCAFYQYKVHARPRVQRAPGVPHALFGRKLHQRLGRIASRGRNRFCTWGTVIARSEATKQSILSLRLDGLLRFARNDDLLLFVVPAKAGTHNPRRVWLRKVFASVPHREDTAYGSRRSPGRRWAALRILTATNSATENSAPCLQTPACWRGGRCCR